MTPDLELFLRGILLGVAVAAPVGPIGVLCIQRSLAGGFWMGFSGGIGTAVADALYAALAAAGFAVLLGGNLGMAGPVPVQQILQWGGALFIAWLGWRTFAAPIAEGAAQSSSERAPIQGNPLRLFVVTFALTMSNPATILSFAALFAGLGLAADPTLGAAASAVAGVFIGSLLWWALLSGGIAALRHRVGAEMRRWINRIAGMVLILFAIALVI
ncbi:LysE family translocator [Ferrovibrio terrae]|uniref:LysE family translocator n=1 Tax=Ferrovibrio terrae TaxID=2594003 RepID=A0A516H695_9PROT|nr:LysE family transporter [Ferrovibrio terrae]QDO99313.1 LysE family translocator [Ferrovibrio terrae]